MVRTLPTAKDMVSSEDKQGLVSPQKDLLSLPVLVLNLNYVPINICTGRRAIVLVEKEKAETLDNYQAEIHTIKRLLHVPSVIRLEYMVKRPYSPRKISKKEIFLRDQYTCQYCTLKTSELTLDHVIPRIQKGPHTWENVVAACSTCNLRKAGRTPLEANMRLLKEPRIPQPNPYRILQNYSMIDPWIPYVPWSMQNQERIS
ncbi:MAG: hypothetical protein CM1200mP15_13630 [Dehalococcoidia bacterium]|nr:MAG: hypothetical protein CM1200mP15_13630 [Dehalococcoidia bacterium]